MPLQLRSIACRLSASPSLALRWFLPGCSPFLLPCLVAVGLSVVAVLLTAFCLEETLPKLRKGGASRAGQGAAAAHRGQGRLAEEDGEGGAGERDSLLTKNGGRNGKGAVDVAASSAEDEVLLEVELGAVRHDGHGGSSDLIASTAANQAKGAAGGHGGASGGGTGAGKVGLSQPGAAQQGVGEGHRKEPSRTDTAAEEELALLAGGRERSAPGHPGPAASPAVWYKNRGVLLVLGGYGLIAFFYNYSGMLGGWVEGGMRYGQLAS